MNGDTFYTGAKPHFLRHTDVPLFISNSGLRDMKKLPQAQGPWAEDSAGFTELQRHGEWTRSPKQYIDDLHRHNECIGPFDWAAQQDWMCEDAIIHGGTFNGQYFVGTHLSVVEHQRRTVGNYLDLKSLDDTLRIIPVVQGRRPQDYEYCISLYDQAGIDLRQEPVVGVGSVCRIQNTDEAVDIIETVVRIIGRDRVHGFGFKTEGLRRVGKLLGSADSHAWSLDGRHEDGTGCDFRLSRDKPHKTEANCLRYMLKWRADTIAAIGNPRPRPLRPDTSKRLAGRGQLSFDEIWAAA